jgi:hypothetical protein
LPLISAGMVHCSCNSNTSTSLQRQVRFSRWPPGEPKQNPHLWCSGYAQARLKARLRHTKACSLSAKVRASRCSRPETKTELAKKKSSACLVESGIKKTQRQSPIAKYHTTPPSSPLTPYHATRSSIPRSLIGDHSHSGHFHA